MKPKVYEETAEYANENIRSGNWKTSGSNLQAVTFYHEMFNRIKRSRAWDYLGPFTEWSYDYDTDKLEYPLITIHDWGCAFGNGTALIQSVFPTAKVVGYDYSEECVKMSKYRWPTLDFVVKNINDADDIADIIFSSHTIEHTERPDRVIANLRKLCQWLVVLIPPILPDKDGGHEGAMLTKEVLNSIKPAPIFMDTYRTVRRYGNDGKMMIEANILMLIQGDLTQRYIIEGID
jgi:SAM-dependent methyltransferase